jgi:hypothetical protein
MTILLYLAAIAVGFISVMVFAASKSAVHEILSSVIGLAACVLFCSAAILDTLKAILRRLDQADRNAWNIGLAQWNELRNPEGRPPEPEANETGYRQPATGAPSARWIGGQK